MSLKDQIEKRVTELTRKPTCSVQRAVLFLYKKNDYFDYIIKIKDGIDNAVDFAEFNSENDIISVLQKQLNVYQLKIQNRELSCPRGLYLLIGFDDTYQLDNKTLETIRSLLPRYFDQSLLEFCILSSNAVSLEITSNIRDCGKIWIINGRDSVVQMLLDNARYAERTFGEIVREDINSESLCLRVDESNAIRQEISEIFLQALRRQLEQHNNLEINDIYDYLFPKEYRRQIGKKTPKIEWLPIFGYEELAEKLEEEYQSIPWWERITRKLKAQQRNSELTVSEVLDILYGRTGNQIKTESFRQSIKDYAVQAICNDYLSSVSTDILSKIYSQFTVYEIRYELRDYLLALKKEAEMHIFDEEQRIDKVLDFKFSYKNTDLKNIYDGLSNYYSNFNKLCRYYLTYTWFDCLADYIGECEDSAADNYHELKEAETVFLLSLIDPQGDYKTVSRTNMRILNIKDLEDQLSRYNTSDATLNLSDILMIMNVKDNYYQNTPDYSVNIAKHPQVYVITSDTLSEFESELENANESMKFTWHFIFEKYMPPQLSYQIRVYNWDEGGV